MKQSLINLQAWRRRGGGVAQVWCRPGVANSGNLMNSTKLLSQTTKQTTRANGWSGSATWSVNPQQQSSKTNPEIVDEADPVLKGLIQTGICVVPGRKTLSPKEAVEKRPCSGHTLKYWIGLVLSAKPSPVYQANVASENLDFCFESSA